VQFLSGSDAAKLLQITLGQLPPPPPSTPRSGREQTPIWAAHSYPGSVFGRDARTTGRYPPLEVRCGALAAIIHHPASIRHPPSSTLHRPSAIIHTTRARARALLMADVVVGRCRRARRPAACWVEGVRGR
jgi:hypothetical protein